MNIFDWLVPISIGAVFLVLCLGLWNMMRGGPGKDRLIGGPGRDTQQQ